MKWLKRFGWNARRSYGGTVIELTKKTDDMTGISHLEIPAARKTWSKSNWAEFSLKLTTVLKP